MTQKHRTAKHRREPAQLSVEHLFIDTLGLAGPDRRGGTSSQRRCDAPATIRRRRLVMDTTDCILDEAITRAFAICPFPVAVKLWQSVFQAREAGYLIVEAITSEHFQKAYQLRLRYRDKPRISFTDLTSFVVMGFERVPQA